MANSNQKNLVPFQNFHEGIMIGIVNPLDLDVTSARRWGEGRVRASQDGEFEFVGGDEGVEDRLSDVSSWL
jgi:hypothetical protein